MDIFNICNNYFMVKITKLFNTRNLHNYFFKLAMIVFEQAKLILN